MMTFPTMPFVRLVLLLVVTTKCSGDSLYTRKSCSNLGGTSFAALDQIRGGDSNTPEKGQHTPLGIRLGECASKPATKKSFKVVQVHVVHRHGDRTPITPLKNEEYWAQSLPPTEVLNKIAENTKLIRDNESKAANHHAGGRGVFGKLTQMGLFQMVELGNRLREELHSDVADDHHVDEEGNYHFNKGRLFHPENPLSPDQIKVISTDFPRTVQSVQGVLVGMFPDGTNDAEIEIDARHTNVMIPDPQPRQTTEQVKLESILAERPHLKEKEESMRDLAMRATEALSDSLGEGAFDVSFGIGEENKEIDDSSPLSQPLPWAQLSEVTKCLQVRGLLPKSLSEEDQAAISSHAAWRWFENLKHPRLAYLAMNNFVSRMVHAMHRKKHEAVSEGQEHPLHIYSAHDSTLIALLCAYRLEQPAQWPEYGSYLKIELMEVTDVEGDNSDIEHYVRFSLNGQVLRTHLGADGNGDPVEMVSLETLATILKNEGSAD